ncbi:phage holin family protein [Micrococcus cohnii]|mgnify:FL=1|uniref:Putative membrane protein YqjE n=1 Tax=Micrococcus cohnii TaxID=993416 RepID=A0A7W7GME9_9MICC|nr:phage holin family protein [Micrococcus cohnii]MBB4734804.1 putative membrane protein YqjE [Micrococcus cohnii]
MGSHTPTASTQTAGAPRGLHVSDQTRSSSMGDLLAALIRLLPLQIKDELSLALSQAKSKGVKIGVAAGLIIVGLVMLAGMLVSLVVAVIGAFAPSQFWLPALLVAAGFLVLGLILAGIGAMMIKGAMPIVPAETVRNLEYDLGYLKEGNNFDPAEYDRVKAERAEKARLEKQRAAERKKIEAKENKKAKKNGEALPHPSKDQASTDEVRRRADLRRRHLGDIRSGLEERASVKGQIAAFSAQRKGRGATADTKGTTGVTAPYTGAARAGEKAGVAEDYVKDRWQPLALLGASGTAFGVLATRLTKRK